jgi:uncharacterized protein (DUF1810 family)
MWFIFPQFTGLGFSSTAQFYAIKSRDEAKAYLNHSVLGLRLFECVEALLRLEGRSAEEILLSRLSQAALLREISSRESVFRQLLAKYYPEGPDPRTIELLEKAG